MSILYKKNTENTNIFDYEIKNIKDYTLKELLKAEYNQYLSITDKYILKNENYFSKIGYKNKATGEIFTKKFDITKKHKEDYFYFNQHTSILDKIQREEGKHSFFYSATLPTEHHKNRNGKLNPKYDYNLTIKDGYDLLNNHLRGIYKDFKVNNKYIPIKYIAVFERHKDNTVHLHAIFYVDPQYKEKFKEYLKNKNKIDGMGKQYDIKDIEEIAKKTKYKNKVTGGSSPIAYLLKYIKKSCSQLDKSWYGWKLAHKIRIFRYSQIPNALPRYIFDRLSKNFRENWQQGQVGYILKNGDKTKKVCNKLDLYNNITNTDITIIDNQGQTLNNHIKISFEPKYNIKIIKERIEKNLYIYENNNYFKQLLDLDIKQFKSFQNHYENNNYLYIESIKFLEKFNLIKEFEEYLFQSTKEILNTYYSLYDKTDYDIIDIQGYLEELRFFLEEQKEKKYTYKLITFDIYDNENNLIYSKPEYEQCYIFE